MHLDHCQAPFEPNREINKNEAMSHEVCIVSIFTPVFVQRKSKTKLFICSSFFKMRRGRWWDKINMELVTGFRKQLEQYVTYTRK